MVTRTILDYLPEVYRGFLPEFFRSPLPSEELADCSTCTMAKPASTSSGEPRFRADLKCCTYYPRIPNYLLGAIVSGADAGSAERRVLDEVLATGRNLTPAFLSPPGSYLEAFRRSELGFGNDAELLCPFHDSTADGCRIWRNRNHQCTTYFCQFRSQAEGQRFWKALGMYLSYAQNTVSRYCCKKLGVRLDASAFDGTDAFATAVESGSEDLAAMFGPFQDDEFGFFERCFQLVGGLTPEAYGRLTGTVHDTLLRRLRASYTAYMNAPGRLRSDPTLHRLPIHGDVVEERGGPDGVS